MKRDTNNKQSVYTYLEHANVLDKGTAAIMEARKAYWKEYKARWRAQKRKSEKEYTVSLDSDKVELLTRSARKHKRSPTQFIKEATFAYISKVYVVPDVGTVRTIAQILAMACNTLQTALQEGSISVDTGKVLLEKIFELERQVLVSLQHPVTLEELVRKYLKEHPECTDVLANILENG